jgi:hypothetical protein
MRTMGKKKRSSGVDVASGGALETPAGPRGCRLEEAFEIFWTEEIDPEGQCSSAPDRLRHAQASKGTTSEILIENTTRFEKLRTSRPDLADPKKLLRQISDAKIELEKASANDDRASFEVISAQEAHLLWRAGTKLRELIKQHDGWFFDYSGLSPFDDELMFTSPSSRPHLTAIPFSIRRHFWNPFVQRFREGKWLAKGRLANFGADHKILPTSLFRVPIKFHLSRSETIEASNNGARFVDVEVYSKERLPQGMNNEAALAQTEPPTNRGGRPQEKPIQHAFYRVIARYRRKGLPEGKTRLVEDIINELIELNEHAGPSTVRDWLVKHARPFYEACGLPMDFDRKDK